MARITTATLDTMIGLCQVKIDTLTDTAASKYSSGIDDSYIDEAVKLRYLIHIMQFSIQMTDKALERVYMYALDKCGAFDTPVATSTLVDNPI